MCFTCVIFMSNMCVYNIWTCSCVKSSKQCYKETKENTEQLQLNKGP